MKILSWLVWLIICLLPESLGMRFMDLILPRWEYAARQARANRP